MKLDTITPIFAYVLGLIFLGLAFVVQTGLPLGTTHWTVVVAIIVGAVCLILGILSERYGK